MAKKHRLNPLQPLPAKYVRKEVWRHNGYIGSVMMFRAQLRSMLASPTLTLESKNQALELKTQIDEFLEGLKTRNDDYAHKLYPNG